MGRIAAELRRPPDSVHHKMHRLAMEGNQQTAGSSRSFITLEEDLCILDKIIDRLSLKLCKLSSDEFLIQSEFTELAKELQRGEASVRLRWGRLLQPWLLQHYTGTTGFRIERMLTSLVAEKFNDHRGIDWSEIVKQYKEFVGHTGRSISHI